MKNERECDDTLNKDHANINKIKRISLLTNKGVLVILSSNFLGKTFIINNKKTMIGRNDNCDIIIDDPLISNEHCDISLEDDGKLYINDLCSKNSTFVNGKEIKKSTQLIYGDRIVLGDTIIRFYLEEKLEKKENN